MAMMTTDVYARPCAPRRRVIDDGRINLDPHVMAVASLIRARVSMEERKDVGLVPVVQGIADIKVALRHDDDDDDDDESASKVYRSPSSRHTVRWRTDADRELDRRAARMAGYMSDGGIANGKSGDENDARDGSRDGDDDQKSIANRPAHESDASNDGDEGKVADDDVLYTLTLMEALVLSRACPCLHAMLADLTTRAPLKKGTATATASMWMPAAFQRDTGDEGEVGNADAGAGRQGDDGDDDDDDRDATEYDASVCIDLCAPARAHDLLVLAAAMLNDRIVTEAPRWHAPHAGRYVCATVARSCAEVEETVDFGVYKRPGFDAALERVRRLPGMGGLTAREAAQRGIDQKGAKHPRDRYNARLVDVVPKEEARGRDGLIATHRGRHRSTRENGLWARLRVTITERDARIGLNADVIVSTMRHVAMALAAVVAPPPSLRGVSRPIPLPETVRWMGDDGTEDAPERP
jgi:hypothetical protein